MTIQCAGRLISLQNPLVMGIVNLTPDSFFQASRHSAVSDALKSAGQMLEAGAAILDVGAYSTRPGAADVSVQVEMSRLMPVLSALVAEFPDAIISVDTFRSQVARAAVNEGASMINDVSAGMLDTQMIPVVARLGVPYVMMHMRGNPQTMSGLTAYDDIILEMLQYFSRQIALARGHGIADLILDPGFGFSKTVDQNFFLLKNLDHFRVAALPILVGISRKAMIRTVTKTDALGALNGTTALHMAALMGGAKILRVHDVREAVETVNLFNKLQSAGA